MSKSLTRVIRALDAAGIEGRPRELGETHTAQQAAAAIGCALDQIVKSIVLVEEGGGATHLFLTAGGNLIDMGIAAAVAGAALIRADAADVRARTGFAIGGVAPLGLTGPANVWLDARLCAFEVVWAAAGTPRHVFPVAPAVLIAATGAQQARFTAEDRGAA